MLLLLRRSNNIWWYRVIWNQRNSQKMSIYFRIAKSIFGLMSRVNRIRNWHVYQYCVFCAFNCICEIQYIRCILCHCICEIQYSTFEKLGFWTVYWSLLIPSLHRSHFNASFTMLQIINRSLEGLDRGKKSLKKLNVHTHY